MMLRPVVFGFLLCTAPFAVAQTPPATQQPQQQQQSPVQPGQPGAALQPGTSEEPNGAATTPPSFAPGAGGSSGATDSLSDAPKVVRISGGVMAAQLIHRVDPVYPQNLQGGQIVLSARIGKDGKVKNVSVVSCPQELQRASVDAVKQWVYKPFLLNGEPVEVDTTVVLKTDGTGAH